MDEWKLAVEQFDTENRYYPDPGSNTDGEGYCLGDRAESSCSVTTMGTFSVSQAANTALQQYLPKLPALPDIGAFNTGPYYNCQKGAGTGKCVFPVINYFIELTSAGYSPTDVDCGGDGKLVQPVQIVDTGTTVYAACTMKSVAGNF